MMKQIQLADYKAEHFGYSVSGKVATITLNRPERKNPLTLESYGELRDLFREMVYATDVKASYSPARAAISVPAATSTTSSANWCR